MVKVHHYCVLYHIHFGHLATLHLVFVISAKFLMQGWHVSLVSEDVPETIFSCNSEDPPLGEMQ